MKPEGNSRENPFLSITFNLIIPVAVLKNGVKWIDRVFPESLEMSSLIHFILDISIRFNLSSGLLLYRPCKKKKYQFHINFRFH